MPDATQRVQWLTHEGTRILLVDFSGLRKDEIVEVLLETESTVIEHGKKDILALVDVTGAHIFGEALLEIKRVRKIIHVYARKTVVVGITGSKAVLLQAVDRIIGSRKTKIFDTKEEAINYLSES